MTIRDYLSGIATLGLILPEAHTRRPSATAQRQGGLRSAAASTRTLVRVSRAAQNLPKILLIAVFIRGSDNRAVRPVCRLHLRRHAQSRLPDMNQGATAHQEHCRHNRRPGTTIDAAAIAELGAESVAVRDQLPSPLIDSTSAAIDLGVDGFLPDACEVGTIAAITYDVAALPPEAQLRADLERFLQMYDASSMCASV